MQKYNMYNIVDWGHCAFGSCYRKRTRLLYANCALNPLGSDKCRGHGTCSYTKRPHTEVAGQYVYGTFHSSTASAYPVKFCDEVAHLLCHSYFPLPKLPPGSLFCCYVGGCWLVRLLLVGASPGAAHCAAKDWLADSRPPDGFKMSPPLHL
eukprot:1248568-Pyramimonas_sp.AAC.1